VYNGALLLDTAEGIIKVHDSSQIKFDLKSLMNSSYD